MNPVTLPWLAEIGLISWRDIKKNGRPPFPSELLATFIAFGAFSLIASGQSETRNRIGGLLGWGLVIATFLNVANQIPYPNTQHTASNYGLFGPVSNSQQTPTVTTPGGAKAQ